MHGAANKSVNFLKYTRKPVNTDLVSHLANFSEVVAVGVNHDGIRVTVDNI